MEYLNAILIFIVLTIIAPILSESNLFPTRRYCGFQHSDDYVRDNANIISLDEFPWIAQLLYDEDKSIKCVGSLINRRYVLTAAHCLFTRDSQMTGVRLGDTDTTTTTDCVNHTRFGEECSDPVEEFDIEELIQHPKYTKRNASNDIGLIRLSRNVVYSDYIRPICLPVINNLELKDGLQLAVSGWGRESYAGEYTTVKKKIFVKLVPTSTCRIEYPMKGRLQVTDNHLCLTEEKGRYTCQGDSGGPLMLSGKRNQWEQVGILSFGKSCGPDYPIVYVKVSRYTDWIRENVHA